jgi:DNA modification methylase
MAMANTTTKKTTKAATKKAAKAKASDKSANGDATPAKRNSTPVKVTEAKGRPMLHWVGKKPLDTVRAYPAQLVEKYSSSTASQAKPNLLLHGDNKDVLSHLLTNGYRGEIKLIYIDPPFDSGADYVRKVQLRGAGSLGRLEGESYAVGEQVQYTDIWANDTYLQFMYERLLLLKELLHIDGSIFMHCDWHKVHYLRCLLDEVFGSENFRNELIVKRGRKKNLQKQFEGINALGVETDTVLLYTKSKSTKFRLLTTPERSALEQWQSFWRGNVTRERMQYEILGFKPTSGQNLWSKERGLQAAENYKAFEKWNRQHPDKTLLEYWKETGEKLEFVKYEEGARCPDYWIAPKEEGILGNDWTDIQAYSYSYDYKTEKHEELLTRVIEMASEPDEIVLDCFIGSGTTAAAAQKLGRRWIGADINKGAIQTTSKRLQKVIKEQALELQQGTLYLEETADGKKVEPTLAFNHYRINDYDLQIQHNEALELALEHIGVSRTRTDSFFEGLLGKKLVKVVPLVHPCTLLDIELVEAELKNRPDEDRNVVMVALGMDANVDAYLAARNKKHPVNKIEFIELRTDAKYGNFFTHQPAWAKVAFKREGKKVTIAIEDFSSPTILQRLLMDETIFKERIADFRSMIDVVLVDNDYDGEVFNIYVSDVPVKKTDLIKGKYEVEIESGKRTVAIKIIDMLGEEVLIAKEV